MNALLHLTHDCNLRCPYCFTGKKFDREMPVETARKSVDFIVQYAKENDQRAVFSFFGGEPMMAWDTLKEVVEYGEKVAAEAGVIALFRMNTNGMLIKDEHLAFFEKHDVIFILSIDGHAAMHDLERRTEGDKGSHHVLADKIPRFLEHNPGMMASVVITPVNVHLAAEGIAYLFDQGFKFLIIKPDVTQGWLPDHVAELDRQYNLVAEDYLARTRKGDELYLNLLDDKWINHAKGAEGISIRCDVGSSQVSIAPSGNIYPCVRWVKEEEDTVPRLGDVWQGFDAPALANIRAQSAAPKSPCGGCSYNDGRCANECACEHYSATGRIGNTLWREKNPVFMQKLYPQLVQLRVERPTDEETNV